MWIEGSNMKNKKIIYKFLVCIAIAMVMGLVGELLYNAPVLLGRKDKILEFNPSEIKYSGFQYDETEGLVQQEDTAKISFKFSEQYVDKFLFNYSGNAQNAMKCKVIVHTKDSEGKVYEKVIDENNNITATLSSTNIRTKTDQIDICLTEMQNLNISSIQINNTCNISLIRIGVIFIVVFWIFWLLLYKGEKGSRPENIFLGIILMLGTLLILALPVHKVSWDEEIHFRNAYGLSYLMEGKSEMFYPPSVELLSVASLHNWPYDLPSSEEEYKLEYKFWNTNGDRALKENEQYYTGRIGVNLYLVGYAAQAIFIEIGKILRMPFSILYLMGRFGNFIMYALVCYWAIKHIPVGKRIMAAIALMPTPLFIACTYSYDATVNAFAFLGISYVIGEILSEEALSKKNCMIFIASFLIVSFIKMIYAPLMLLGLLIPNDRFSNKKERNIFKSMLVILVLCLCATFILPAGSSGGDLRGGDTSVGRQLKVVFGHPIVYTKLLLSSIWDKLLDYSVGTSSMSLLGHLGEGKYTQWIIALLVGVALTDKCENEKKLNGIEKAGISVVIFIIVCLIWTALYLSFTVVGADSIAGVQGRYFIPLVIPGLLLFNFNSIENKGDSCMYSKIVIGLSGCLTLFTYYGIVIKQCF